MFRKYMHLERWGTDETLCIQNGADTLYVFPKLDGTNGSLWIDPKRDYICCGSRRRPLSSNDDNRNFFNAINGEEGAALHGLLSSFPGYVFYGEWLCSHTIKDYLDSAWHKFYVFDVFDKNTECFLSYDSYKPLVEQMAAVHPAVELLPPLAVARKLDEPTLQAAAEKNYYLMKEGSIGEGVVIKRYGFVNRYGRTVWAKYVRNEFKAKHIEAMGPATINMASSTEETIVDKYITEFLVLKTVEKLRDKYEFEGRLPSKHIAELLQTIYYDLIQEELWAILKETKNPTINFTLLHKLCYNTTKAIYGI